MAQLKIDTLKETEYERTREGIRVVRSAIVYNLDTSVPYAVMTNSLFAAGMPQVGELHPVIPGCFVIGHRIRFETDAMTRVGVVYETPRITAGGPPNQWQIRDSSTLVSIQASRHPALQQGRLYTTYKNPNDSNDPGTTKTATVTYLRPVRVLTAQGNFTTRLPDSSLAMLGKVNQAPWLGYGAGFWLVNGIEQDTRDGGSTWDQSVSLMNNLVEDWSSYAVSVKANGETEDIQDSVVRNIESNHYTYGIITDKGISRFGLYATADFNAAFAAIAKRYENPNAINPTGLGPPGQ